MNISNLNYLIYVISIITLIIVISLLFFNYFSSGVRIEVVHVGDLSEFIYVDLLGFKYNSSTKSFTVDFYVFPKDLKIRIYILDEYGNIVCEGNNISVNRNFMSISFKCNLVENRKYVIAIDFNNSTVRKFRILI